MKKILVFMLTFVLATTASAQVRVTGRVIDLQNKPVSDVIVKMVSGSKTLAFTSSNAQGVYSLEVKNALTGEVTLQFTHISYEKESERLSLKERVTKVDMVLTPKAVSLKEVTVKPDPLRQKGDTLTHNLASFLGKGDVTLEDGLKRLPGVDVSEVSIEADMPCEVRIISGRELQALFDNDPKMAKMDVKILKNLFKMVYGRDLDHYRYTARSRYRRLIDRCPQVVQMLSLKDIASFLNITPIYLSKIRKELTFGQEKG